MSFEDKIERCGVGGPLGLCVVRVSPGLHKEILIALMGGEIMA